MQYLMDLEAGDVFHDIDNGTCVLLDAQFDTACPELLIMIVINIRSPHWRRGVIMTLVERATRQTDHLSNCINDGSF